MDLFTLSEDAGAAEAPLAARMRPRTLAEFLGQEHVVGPGTVVRSAVQRGELSLHNGEGVHLLAVTLILDAIVAVPVAVRVAVAFVFGCVI